MSKSEQIKDFSKRRFLLTLLGIITFSILIAYTAGSLLKKPNLSGFPASKDAATYAEDTNRLNQIFRSAWQEASLAPVPEADFYTLARRLSLSLTGAVPSLEEIRRLENTPEKDRLNAWLDHLFRDQRYTQYMAERLARVYVGVETGPFLVYRRRRMVNWIADQLTINRPYDAMARELIAARGIWTTSPAANFITVTNMQGKMNGPDEIKLAARTSRAFLGVSLDCVQCHDDKFGDRWKQQDFHQLAAFFAQSEIAINGVTDNPSRDYETRFRGKAVAEPVAMKVPFQSEIFTEKGAAREQLANWITHRENRSFSRAVANRVWAILFGKPLVTPIDDIPIDGPVPPALEQLADAFVSSDFDLRALFRIIANCEPFLRSSQSGDDSTPITGEQEKAWAAFPLTQLRPEQVAGSIIQAASIQALDSSSHIIKRLTRSNETREFVNRYGDKGESEFAEGSGTIPQRLILMNGKLVNERTEPNPIMNASTRIATLAKAPRQAVETSFLAVLTRLPSAEEAAWFQKDIETQKGDNRQRAVQDLYWALMNSTEFSWNR